MRVPLSWLAEYVSFPRMSPPRASTSRWCRLALRKRVSTRFEVTGPIVVGEVLEFVEEPQSNGKTIRWCQVKVAKADRTR
jgi:phenylalanyl-tRNA synthetase beta chain